MARSSSSNNPLKYDVFLSFRGTDTRRNFTCHLYAALQRKGIFTFIDSTELDKGSRISKLLEAIEMSKISIVVFSIDYASSVWCLKELAKIMECLDSGKMRRVVPVFYNVEPADIKYQRKSFLKAFDEHRKTGRLSLEVLEIWQSALHNVAGISGFNSDDSKDDSELVEEIATQICKYLKPNRKHDVFISCHKDDAQPKFVSHFCAELKRKGISTIIPTDDAGRVKAIDESGLSVIVFSDDYPWSRVCFNQLVQIIERMDKMKKPTVVIYYDLASSDVRNKKGSFEDAFAEYEQDRDYTKEELKKWKYALTRASTIPDCWETLDDHTNPKDNRKIIENLCEHIREKLNKT